MRRLKFTRSPTFHLCRWSYTLNLCHIESMSQTGPQKWQNKKIHCIQNFSYDSITLMQLYLLKSSAFWAAARKGPIIYAFTHGKISPSPSLSSSASSFSSSFSSSPGRRDSSSTKFRQILPYSANFCWILPFATNFYQILPNSAQFCLNSRL